MKTIITDLDGCLVKHAVPSEWYKPLEMLPGSKEKLNLWYFSGFTVIIMTARSEGNKRFLESELKRLKIQYDHLVTDAGCGHRYLINDTKPENPIRPTAHAINLERNKGISEIEF